jgi:hypothetical protein
LNDIEKEIVTKEELEREIQENNNEIAFNDSQLNIKGFSKKEVAFKKVVKVVEGKGYCPICRGELKASF